MATEGPQLRDGGNLTAAANYYNPTSALAGPGGSGQFLGVGLSLSVARTALLIAVTGAQGIGILQNKPAAGDAANVCFSGVSKAVVGSAGSTLGKPQMFDSTGCVTDWTAGSGYAQVGWAYETGVAGAIIEVLLAGPSPKVLT